MQAIYLIPSLRRLLSTAIGSACLALEWLAVIFLNQFLEKFEFWIKILGVLIYNFSANCIWTIKSFTKWPHFENIYARFVENKADHSLAEKSIAVHSTVCVCKHTQTRREFWKQEHAPNARVFAIQLTYIFQINCAMALGKQTKCQPSSWYSSIIIIE